MKLGVPHSLSAKGKKGYVALRSAARYSLGAAPLSGLDLLLAQHCLPSLTQKKIDYISYKLYRIPTFTVAFSLLSKAQPKKINRISFFGASFLQIKYWI